MQTKYSNVTMLIKLTIKGKNVLGFIKYTQFVLGLPRAKQIGLEHGKTRRGRPR